MKFTSDHRAKLESMLASRAIHASERQAIRAALARIDELERELEQFCNPEDR